MNEGGNGQSAGEEKREIKIEEKGEGERRGRGARKGRGRTFRLRDEFKPR